MGRESGEEKTVGIVLDIMPQEEQVEDSDQDVCRICHSGNDAEQFISPCLCTGSAKYVHPSCLMSWFQ